MEIRRGGDRPFPANSETPTPSHNSFLACGCRCLDSRSVAAFTPESSKYSALAAPIMLVLVIALLVALAAIGAPALGLALSRRSRARALARAARELALLPLSPSGCFLAGKSVLVIANPFGGRGEGEQIVRLLLEPALARVGAKVECVVTQAADHGYSLARSHAGIGTSVDCIIVVGGDGMLHAVLNGLACRGDSASFTALRRRLVLALVPAGTSNGLASSRGWREASLAVRELMTSAEPRDVDLSCLEFRGSEGAETRRLVDVFMFSSCLILCLRAGLAGGDSPVLRSANSKIARVADWAIVGDHDELQERRLRWMVKPLREILAPASVILRRRVYSARLHMCLAQATPALTQADVGAFGTAAGLERSDVGDGWVALDGEFIMLSATHVAWGAHDVHISPGKAPTDGCVDLCIIPGHASRWQLVRLFLGMASGAQLTMPDVFQRYRVSAFRIEQLGAARGSVSVSGEAAPCTRVMDVRVLPGAVRML